VKYVTKNIDELMKNHRADDKEKLTAMMPEQPDSPFCPVRSFEKYLSKLHPICNNSCTFSVSFMFCDGSFKTHIGFIKFIVLDNVKCFLHRRWFEIFT
jgi:hypothetical protein